MLFPADNVTIEEGGGVLTTFGRLVKILGGD